MEEEIVYNEADKSYTQMLFNGDVEYVDPVQHYRNKIIETQRAKLRLMFSLKKHPLPAELIDTFILTEAKKVSDRYFSKVIRTSISSNFMEILTSKRKNEQERLLKGAELTPEQLYAFIYRAWIQHGFTLSEYYAEHLHAGVQMKTLPKLVRFENNVVYKVGKTNLTDGQLKQVIEHRKVTVSKFFDKEDTWHCLFTTYDSLNGKESWNEGQPHFHYISDKFGIPRDEIVRQLKSKSYKLPSLPHIAYIV